MTKRYGRALDPEEVLEIALRAIDGDGCVDRLACAAIFGNPRGPKMWGQYSDEAKRSWDDCVRMYDALRAQFELTGDRKRKDNVRRITLDEAWAALLYLTNEESPGESKFSWARVGEILGVGARAAQYQLLQRMGFKVRGTSTEKGVYAGPCLGCRTVTAVEKLTDLTCGRCRKAKSARRALEDPTDA